MSADRVETAVVILAAGQGTRMKSGRAKVLHEICGRPLLGYPLTVAESLSPSRLMVVVGRDAEQVQQTFAGRAEFVLQAEQNGTGHAVLQTASKLRGFDGDVLILYGDTPLLTSETLQEMRRIKQASGAGLVLLSAPEKLPGRIVRDASGQVVRIVEKTDATPAELAIEEGNTGVYLVDSDLLWDGLSQVDDNNEQGEIYLTDVVSYAFDQGRGVEALRLETADESLGVNDRSELARAAAVVRGRTLDRLMSEGVSIVDPASTFIDVDVEIGRDSLIEPGCVIQGASVLGERVHLKPHCMIEASQIGDDSVLGPAAHLRPDSVLGCGVRIGNYVEVKNSNLGDGVKADHLSYIGDADVGDGAAFGCGSIVVNYNWQSKSRTVVGAGATVGCNVNLVAPVEVGANSAVAAGSTVTHSVPADSLAVARAKQRNVEGWVARREGRSAPAPADAGSIRKKAPTSPAKAKKPARKAGSKKPAAKKPVPKKARTSAKKQSSGASAASKKRASRTSKKKTSSKKARTTAGSKKKTVRRSKKKSAHR